MHIVELSADVHRRAVGQMSAVVQIHGQNGVAGRQQAHIGGDIGGRAAVRLDVDMVIGPEDLAPHVAAVFLQLVHVFAPAVIPAPAPGGPDRGVSLGIFVGQTGANGAHHVGADEVFAGDQLDVAVLTFLLFFYDLKDFGRHGGTPFLRSVPVRKKLDLLYHGVWPISTCPP